MTLADCAAPTTAERIRSTCVRADQALLAIEGVDGAEPLTTPLHHLLADGSFAVTVPVDCDADGAQAVLELAGRSSAAGRWAASHRRTCAAATGKAASVRTSAAVRPCLTTMLKATSSVSSANTCSGVPIARLSRVGVTEPSIEFSIGTQA